MANGTWKIARGKGSPQLSDRDRRCPGGRAGRSGQGAVLAVRPGARLFLRRDRAGARSGARAGERHRPLGRLDRRDLRRLSGEPEAQGRKRPAAPVAECGARPRTAGEALSASAQRGARSVAVVGDGARHRPRQPSLPRHDDPRRRQEPGHQARRSGGRCARHDRAHLSGRASTPPGSSCSPI